MNRARARFLVVVSSVALIASGLIAGAPTAAQAITIADIGSASGPLTHIYISDTLSCQVAHTDDSVFEWYNPGSQTGDCGTVLYIGPNDSTGTVFGPAGSGPPSSPAKDVEWTAVSQSSVTGTGAPNDPLTVVTVVDAGASGVRLTQTDSYVIGEESYRTDVRLDNTTNSAVDAVLYRHGDCYLGGDDRGYGIHDAQTGAVGCRKTLDANSRVEEWVPITDGSNYYESFYNNVANWPVGAPKGKPFPNTSEDSTFQDNGTGISWTISIPANGHVTRSELSAFSPTGVLPLVTSKTADDSSVPPDSSDGYTITVHNPNVADVTLNDVTDNLPAGFHYVTGSSSGGTTNNPAIETGETGENLTWSGPFTVPAGANFSLHFGVVVSSTPDNYNNQAGADAANNYSVAPTGPTAQVTVEQPVAQADLAITKTDGNPVAATGYGPDPVSSGQLVAYKVSVTNNGPNTGTGIQVIDTVGGGGRIAGASGTGWTCPGPFTSTTITTTCTRASLASGPAPAITVQVKAPSTSTQVTINDTSTVSGNEDPSSSNNTATESTTVRPANAADSAAGFYDSVHTLDIATGFGSKDSFKSEIVVPPSTGTDGYQAGPVTDQEKSAKDPLYIRFCGSAQCDAQVDISTLPSGSQANTTTDPGAPIQVILYFKDDAINGDAVYAQGDGQASSRLLSKCDSPTVAKVHGNVSKCVASITTTTGGDRVRKIVVLVPSGGDPIFGKH